MPASERDLFERLDALGIETTTHRHAPMFTVAESKALRGDLPGGHCKSLFLKDKKGVLWLVVTLEDTPLDMKALSDRIGSARLSFGRPELMEEVLGVAPGSVTPFALVNQSASAVRVVLEARMLDAELLNYHPLTNEATTAIRPADLVAFIADCGHEPMIVAL